MTQMCTAFMNNFGHEYHFVLLQKLKIMQDEVIHATNEIEDQEVTNTRNMNVARAELQACNGIDIILNKNNNLGCKNNILYCF